jgi:hypothetical protein
MTIETGVLERYSQGAESIQADLCCPVDYDLKLLALLAQEICIVSTLRRGNAVREAHRHGFIVLHRMLSG